MFYVLFICYFQYPWFLVSSGLLFNAWSNFLFLFLSEIFKWFLAKTYVFKKSFIFCSFFCNGALNLYLFVIAVTLSVAMSCMISQDLNTFLNFLQYFFILPISSVFIRCFQYWLKTLGHPRNLVHIKSILRLHLIFFLNSS